MPEPLRQILLGLQRFIIETTPKVITAIVVGLALLFLARLVEKLLRQLLTRLPVDRLLQQAGVEELMKKAGVGQAASAIIPRLVYYLLLLLFARVAADAYGLVAISSAIGALFGYLPKLAAALLLLIVGTSVSRIASEAVERGAASAGIDFAPTLGKLVGAFVLFIVIAMAIGQLEFDTAMVRIVTACLLGGFALAFAISFGFGSRDVTRNVLAGFYARKLFRPGEQVEVGGVRGVLSAITPTQTLIEQGEVTVAVSNGAFLDVPVQRGPTP
ncbi:MAG: mechanosensitive ion channel [Gemmatimonadaceae bacterium]|nr:mechanosensitive ion channel [Gemmatimonadaceae bacterium]